MEMTRHQITVRKTAHYAQLGSFGPATRHVWILLHGYGQLSAYFIRKFQSIASDDTVLIAPEGLHRFYLKEHSGRVGASWMTKEDRLLDIQDYCNYLDTLYTALPLEGLQVTVLGFSQGGATACRWVGQTIHKIHQIILWGSVTPPDMNWEEHLPRMRHLRWFLVTGSQDAFIQPEQVSAQLDLLKKMDIAVQTLSYEGGHDLDETLLTSLAATIRHL